MVSKKSIESICESELVCTKYLGGIFYGILVTVEYSACMLTTKQKLRRYTKLHLLFTAILFGVYFLSCFFYNPDFFAKDIQSKIHVFADPIVVTGVVLAPPVTPVIQAQAFCIPQAVMQLDWADDVNSTSYDVYRNNVPLVSGISVTEYQDTFISPAASYQYKVVAHGPMGTGIATSATVSITSRHDCEGTTFTPSLSVISIGSQNISGDTTNNSVQDDTPRITGVTNIPGATISWSILGDTIITGIATVNANGFWEFTVPVELKDRNYILSITAYDQNNSNISANSLISFTLDAYHQSSQNTSGHAQTGSSAAVNNQSNQANLGVISQSSSDGGVSAGADQLNGGLGTTNNTSQSTLSPLDFSVALGNQGQVYYGENMLVHIVVKNIQATPADALFTLIIRNAQGEIIVQESFTEALSNGQNIDKELFIPTVSEPGEYTLDVIARIGNFEVTRTNSLSIAELPFLRFGQGHVITYAQFLRNLGWVTFGGVFATGVFSLLWLREYQLFGMLYKGKFIDNDLNNRGFVRKGKGVKK